MRILFIEYYMKKFFHSNTTFENNFHRTKVNLNNRTSVNT